MKLTHSQISEILSNYTSSSEGFVTLQSLIMNSLMYHERELFVQTTDSPYYRQSYLLLVVTPCVQRA